MSEKILLLPEKKIVRLEGKHAVSYADSGETDLPVVVMFHDFSAFPCTWESLIPHFRGGFRCIRPDFGMPADGEKTILSNYEQAELAADFIRALHLKRITLIGHGFGGELILRMLSDDADIRARTDKTILISPSGFLRGIPRYIEEIASLSPGSALLRLTHAKLIAHLLLEYVYARPERLREPMIRAYAENLDRPGCIQHIILSAREYRLADSGVLAEKMRVFDQPFLLIWGQEDRIIPSSEMELFRNCLKHAESALLPDCGHMPQEEFPEETSALISAFLNRGTGAAPPEETRILKEKVLRSPLRISRLFDRWTFGTILLAIVLKLLQFFRKLGVRANEQGWRKITGIFLKNEYSKFGLAAFHLDYAAGSPLPLNEEDASGILARKLYEYFRTRPEIHWAIEYRSFSFSRQKIFLCDVVKAEVASDGALLRLTPYFTKGERELPAFSRRHMEQVLEAVICVYNRNRNAGAGIRQQVIRKELNSWVGRAGGFHFITRQKLHLLVERVMTAIFVYTELPPEDSTSYTLRTRLRSPDLRKYRHPGWGMMCVLARFTKDFSEVDLHFQFHHVTADGVPMQNMLNGLKKVWGVRSPFVLPAMNFPVAPPETVYCGDGVFRARLYVDFTQLLEIRKYLNKRYFAGMGGPASFAGLVMWGLSMHDFFRRQKMLLPVDAGVSESGERDLGLLFIRPGTFRDDSKKLASFLNFQKEMNRRMYGTRAGRSESGEFLTLVSMLHPFVTQIARYLAHASLDEVIGTMGISIIRDADVFTSPLTDLQTKGFMTIGSVTLPTENGRRAGSVCVCATRRQIRCYIEAIRSMVTHFPDFLGLPENWNGGTHGNTDGKP